MDASMTTPIAHAKPEIPTHDVCDEETTLKRPVQAVPIPSAPQATAAGSNVYGNGAHTELQEHNAHEKQTQCDHVEGMMVGCECLLCGDSRVRRVKYGLNWSVALCGDTHVDLHDARLPPGAALTFLCLRLCGDVNLCVPPGTRVAVRRLLLCGSQDVYVDDDVGPGAPRVTLTVLTLCGDVRVRSDPNEMP